MLYPKGYFHLKEKMVTFIAVPHLITKPIQHLKMRPFFKNQTDSKPPHEHHISYRHNVGEEVFFMYMNGVRKAIVTNVVIKKSRKATDIWCVVDKNPCGPLHSKTFREEELYSTKAELLESL
ncbi:hypothetical protein FUA48_11355 [Flavobacterium alkalisoli]|uniref:Uncharacterized protein n=1 Tax=Flavobacterium alkalisoli TaxID=2602769 RepID=A0A5B9FYZ8_9FLAO|nr:hypothetical protein [Flavobacterium alkalisoli]QEE50152.1 hypothetical protein FUA48_11355 [Flavobacterium alkalisoli]